MKSATDIQQKIVVQTNTVCNMGTVRYRVSNALVGENRYTLSDEFKNAIRLLPLTYDAVKYTQFLNDWGTVSRSNLDGTIYQSAMLIIIPYNLKFSKLKIFADFGTEHGHENFLARNFKFITAVMHGWKLDHGILSMKICFKQNCEIFIPRKFIG